VATRHYIGSHLWGRGDTGFLRHPWSQNFWRHGYAWRARHSTRVVVAEQCLMYKRAGARTGSGSVIQKRGRLVSCASTKLMGEKRL